MSELSAVARDDVRSLLGEQICKGMGLDAGRILRLQIVIEAGEIPVLLVTRALFGKDCGGPFTKVMEQYQVIPIPSAPSAVDQDSTPQD
jgi:hypothetical protein